MKIEDLNKQIKSGQLKTVYFFYGEEQYLLKHKLAAMEKKLITPGTEDFNYIVFEGKKTEIEQVIEAVETFPQMSERKIVLVKNSGFWNNGNGKEYKRLQAILPDLPIETCLIFVEDQFDKKKEKNLKTIEEYGGVVEFAYLPINKVELWLEEKIRKEEKQIAPKELSYMVQLCGLSLGKIQMELDKLLNYLGERNKVTRADIDAVVAQSVEYRVYDMLDNIVAGHSGKGQSADEVSAGHQRAADGGSWHYDGEIFRTSAL